MNITYLLGAGASAQIVPTVRNFPSQIIDLHSTLERFLVHIPNERYPGSTGQAINATQKEAVALFLTNLKKLSEKLKQHISFDTYARILYLTGEQRELRTLKGLLDLFLSTLQIFRGVDPRYDLFFSSIAEGGNDSLPSLPGNIKVLSWNYDFQAELSIKRLFRRTTLEDSQKSLNVYLNSVGAIQPSVDTFSWIKINGSSGGFWNREAKHTCHYFDINKTGQELGEDDKIKWLIYIGELYSYLSHNRDPSESSIVYSWEKNKYSNPLREVALSQSRLTEVLVVIGYSFPTFNRAFDKQILSNMEKLTKIYVQNTPENIGGAVSRLQSLLANRFYLRPEPIDSVDEFHIPFEY